ncbi:reverse transcriptase domain-containing protein [Tanacetum coccineum]
MIGGLFQNHASTSGTLPRNTIPNPKGEMKAINTRSGVAYEEPSIPTKRVVERETEETTDKEQSNFQGSTTQIPPPVTPIPTSEPDKIFQIIQDLRFDISFADALLLMPIFAPTIKSLLMNKEKLLELAKIPLNENCSAMLLKKLPEKLGDPGKFLIPCNFPGMDVCHALADLGASINLMPLSIWKKLSLPELTPTRMTLELADRSITHPKGVAEDVFVKVGSFHFPTDFVVVDFEADPRDSLAAWEMNKGFLNRSATASKDVDNNLIGKGSLLGDLASKIRNIYGKILGRDGKPMVARRCVRFADTTKESVCGDGRSVNNDSSMAEPSSQAVEQPLMSDHQKFMVHGDGIRPELRSIDEIKAHFVNTLYGFPVGKRLAFPMVENYVKHAWAKFGLKRVMMHHGFFMFQFDSKTGMEKVMEGGPWRIQLVPFILKVWMPNTLLKKEKVSNVPLWVKMHNVPIVAYSKVGLDLISAKVGRLTRLDAHTNFICLNSWGRSDYARALMEVSTDKPLVDSVDIDIPREDGKGYTTVNVRIEFEWQPPRCGTCKIFDHLESVCPMKRVAGPSKKSDMQADVKKDKRYIKGYRVNIPKSKLVYRAVVKPQGDNNVASNMEQSLDTTKKPSPSDSSKNDDICFDELRNFVDNSAKEESVLEYVGNKDINGCTSREKQGDKVSTKKSSSSMEILNEDSDTDVDEVFLPNDGIPFPSSSGADPRVPLILERSFLRTSRALIDVYKEELVLRDGNEQITFHVDGTSKPPQKHINESIKMVNNTCKDNFKKFTDEPTLVCLPPPKDVNNEKEKQEVKNLIEPTAKRQTRITPCLKNFRIICKESILHSNKTSQVSSVFAITSTLPFIEPKDSLIMGDEHLSTFSAEEIVPIPRESEDTFRSDSENILPSCGDLSSINVPRDDSVTFSNPLFEFDVNFNSSDINPLFDKVLEDIECKDSYDSNLDESTFLVTPLSDSNKDKCLTPRDDIEFLLHHDPSTPLKSVASILKGFINEPLFKENDDLFDLESKTNDWKRILYDTQIDKAECFDPGGDNDEIDAFLAIEVPTYIEGYYDSEGDVIYLESFLSDDTTRNLSPEVFFDHEPQHIENESDHVTFFPKSDPFHHDNSSSQSPENSHTIIESLPSSITLIEDSNSNREEINVFSGPDDLISPGIESDFDSEEDNLLNNDPIPKYECLTFIMEPDVPVINNVDELNEDECFDPGGGKINVEVDDSFTFVTRTFLPYLTYPEVSSLLSSTENEDTIFDPEIST